MPLSTGVLSDVARRGAGGGGGALSTQGAMVRRAATQAIPDSAWTPASFDTEDRDDDGFWAIGTPTNFACGSDGWHVITYAVDWEIDIQGKREMRIRLDGGATIRYGITREQYAGGLSDSRESMTLVEYLTAGQYVELELYQNAGHALNADVLWGEIARLS